MEAFALAASVAVVIVSGTYLVLTLRAEARRRKRERALAEMLDLANEALEADIARVKRGTTVASGVMEVDPSSPLGRELLEQIRMGCQCPNCEETRRIAHAEQQKRGEQ
ncbi:hypothetical protein [Leucobacter sp. VD1]|uniref:hypothetical protein n=1 Tax=Leucobacter sp. VD1 TaxID=3080381 RepID=UPI00301852BA